MMGHCSRFRENANLPRRGLAIQKNPPLSNACVLIMLKIMRSRDVQCNTGEIMTLKRKFESRLQRSLYFALTSVRKDIKQVNMQE